jgi:hypothetical protein
MSIVRPWLLAALLLAAGLLAGNLCELFAQDSLPPTPQGVEVQARGPIHEAYAALTCDPVPSKLVPKRPPDAIEELPPAEKPEGNALWIGGYWAWDDDSNDFLWVSGTWRIPPPNKTWVAGYWREQGGEWQWVAGFWTNEASADEQEITYLPQPPAPPDVAPPPKPVNQESFFVPGTWVWVGDRYAWRAGYWARVQPGYVWVNDHYRWTPSGVVYIAGYWDLALKSRGILYAPVIIRPSVVQVGFVYTPAYAVRDVVVVDSLFVRPTTCHYYFGDYYGPSYRTLGYESCVVYSQRRYDSIIVYERYERRADPTWVSLQINLFNDRSCGRAAVPPRTLVQQQNIINNTVVNNNNTTIVNNNTTVVNNITMIAPTNVVTQTKNMKTVVIDNSARQQVKQQAVAVQKTATQRSTTEVALKPGAPAVARKASITVPKPQPAPLTTNAAAQGKPPVTTTKPEVKTASNPMPKAEAKALPMNAAPKNSAPATNPNLSKPASPMTQPKTLATPNPRPVSNPIQPVSGTNHPQRNPIQPAGGISPGMPRNAPPTPYPGTNNQPRAQNMGGQPGQPMTTGRPTPQPSRTAPKPPPSKQDPKEKRPGSPS